MSSSLDFGNNRVVEVLAGGGPQITLLDGLNGPSGVAVDGTGNLFIADRMNNRVLELALTSMNFGSVMVQSSSTLTLNYHVLGNTNLGTAKVVTQGSPESRFHAGRWRHLHRRGVGRQQLHSERELRAARARSAHGHGAALRLLGQSAALHSGLRCWPGSRDRIRAGLPGSAASQRVERRVRGGPRCSGRCFHRGRPQ